MHLQVQFMEVKEIWLETFNFAQAKTGSSEQIDSSELLQGRKAEKVLKCQKCKQKFSVWFETSLHWTSPTVSHDFCLFWLSSNPSSERPFQVVKLLLCNFRCFLNFRVFSWKGDKFELNRLRRWEQSLEVIYYRSSLSSKEKWKVLLSIFGFIYHMTTIKIQRRSLNQSKLTSPRCWQHGAWFTVQCLTKPPWINRNK